MRSRRDGGLWALGAVIVLLLSAAIYLLFALREGPELRVLPSSERLSRLIYDFRAAQYQPTTINLDALFPNGVAETFVHPGSVLPTTHLIRIDQARQLYKFAQTCQGKKPKDATPVVHKAWTWTEFECAQIKAPDDSFFSTPPYFHPSGQSYVALAIGHPEYSAVEWKRAHITLAHASEAPAFKVEMSAAQSALATLDRFSSLSLASHQPIVLGPEKIFFRDLNNHREGIGSNYAAYSRNAWEKFISAQGLMLSAATPGVTCLWWEGNLCLSRESKSLRETFRRAREMLLGLSLLLLLTGIIAFARMLRSERKAQNHRRLALQLLTHELRTPLAALKVQVELAREGFDSWPDERQDQFLKLNDSVERLSRLAETSRRYLESGTKSVGTIPSMRQLILEVLEGFSDVRLSEGPDASWSGDAAAVAFCLRNLVENAQAHGKAPVVVTLKPDSIEVQDQGSGDLPSLDKMCREFSRDRKSQGMGLGLSIVRNLAQSLGAELQVKTKPTRFRIVKK